MMIGYSWIIIIDVAGNMLQNMIKLESSGDSILLKLLASQDDFLLGPDTNDI